MLYKTTAYSFIKPQIIILVFIILNLSAFVVSLIDPRLQ